MQKKLESRFGKENVLESLRAEAAQSYFTLERPHVDGTPWSILFPSGTDASEYDPPSVPTPRF